MNICSIEGCGSKSHSLGLCNKHYTRKYRKGSTEDYVPKSIILKNNGRGYCASCKQEKPVSEFNSDKCTVHGLARYCRQCNKIKSVARYKTHTDQHRNVQLKSDFGITLEDYNKLLASQNGVCAICGRKEWQKNKKGLSVDHNHKDNNVRGLLCSKCNFGLGHFNDDVLLLTKAIEYLSKGS